jgi:hypothetical protein
MLAVANCVHRRRFGGWTMGVSEAAIFKADKDLLWTIKGAPDSALPRDHPR